MKKIAVIPLLVLLCSFVNWHYNLQQAEQIARNSHRYVLLNFSGSDWCGPCIRLHKEIFAAPEFTAFADTSLVMVNADFPRNKKNQLSATQQSVNDELAGKYNNEGDFPLTLLLNADGKVLKKWIGYPKGTASDFIADINNTISNDGHKQ